MTVLDDLAGLVRDDGIVIGAAPAAAYTEAEDAIRQRRHQGLFADMRFTMHQPHRSCHPERALRGARTVISALLPVARPFPPPPPAPYGVIARYAWADPYDALRSGLGRVRDALRAAGARAAVFVDDNAHVDREGARRAGLTFYGKNTMAIAPGLGSYVAIGTVITDAAVSGPPPAAVREGCGSCRRCIDACPTGALDQPGVLDANRCLSYWTQSRDDAPPDVRRALENRVYGCDICQEVCPWNTGPARRGAPAGSGEAFVALRDWLTTTPEQLAGRYRRFYIPGGDGRYLQRNALVALANEPAGAEELAVPFLGADRMLATAARRILDRS
jgi:epoxyqueuosine reductase